MLSSNIMERLREIPPEITRYNPAYEHLGWWLVGEGISPEFASEFTFRSYLFQRQTTEILGAPEVGIVVTGKGHEHGLSPTLRFNLMWPGFVSPADEIRPGLERVLSQTFASEVGEVAKDVVHVELNFVNDLPEMEDHHIGIIGLTREGAEKLSRTLNVANLDPDIANRIYSELKSRTNPTSNIEIMAGPEGIAEKNYEEATPLVRKLIELHHPDWSPDSVEELTPTATHAIVDLIVRF